MEWRDLSWEQKCVIANASEESDLFATISSWNPDYRSDFRTDDVDRLRDAVLTLVDYGIVEAYPWTTDPAEPQLERAELAAVLSNRRAWWNDGRALEDVVWLVLSRKGNELLANADASELRLFWEGKFRRS